MQLPCALATALTAAQFLLPPAAVQAGSTWCKFYIGHTCTYEANNGVSFDCSNPAVFESETNWVMCHHGRDVGYMCLVSRCSDENCTCARNMVAVTGHDECLKAGGTGSWYQLRALESS
ncbi:hypothetical protein PG984_010372 [Apiospora sp. TS-2023a]